jgi:hypothetical protein
MTKLLEAKIKYLQEEIIDLKYLALTSRQMERIDKIEARVAELGILIKKELDNVNNNITSQSTQ